MNRRFALAAALWLPLALTACDSSSRPSTLNTAPAPSSSSPAADLTDQQRAAAIQLTVADLPSGWKAQQISTTPAQRRAEDAYFDGCLGVPTIESTQTTSSDVEFGRADGFAFADGLINVTKTQAQADGYNTALTGPKTAGCAEATAKKFFKAPKDSTIAGIVGIKLTVPDPGFGYRVVITLHLTSKNRDVRLTLDTYGVVAKRFIVQVAFTGVIQPPQQSLEDSVSAKVFARATGYAA